MPLPPPIKEYTLVDDNSTIVEQNLTRPLQVYHRHPQPPQARPSSNTSVDPPTSDLHIPIPLRKNKHSTITHPISHFVT